MLTLLSLNESLRNDWDYVVDNARNGLFLFKWDYITYHADRFTDCSLVVYKKNKPIAIFPANEVDGTVYSHQGLTFGGLISLKELHATEIIEIIKNIVLFYKDKNIHKMIYKKIPTYFTQYPCDEDLYAISLLGAKLIRRDLSSIIKCSNKIKLSDSRKSTINKAKKSGVLFYESQRYDAFHMMLSNALEKYKAKPVHTLNEIEFLLEKFPNNIRLFIAAMTEESDPLAGVLVYEYDEIVHTQYMASTEDGRKLGALDYILASLINEVYSEKEYFSFGISTENNGEFLNEGLIKQKEGFGARGVVHDFYSLELL
ncbi:GNAT family N-acetyltransferase [Buttiauxella sp. A2-C1_F]|uniref:GNAT family N-acetyltransferase n=1 Tax=Buttiauxella sp. A2-C1_F TaxID=2904526 RepID=UPI001E5C6CB6|nr:GNAT family N-acetyltransferase [Buttiauxella sp. A2-C1_F]MCE0846437.1 GNAT family N-acetyltransferase [Buttiauxella sp. A2-C1_F]